MPRVFRRKNIRVPLPNYQVPTSVSPPSALINVPRLLLTPRLPSGLSPLSENALSKNPS